MAKLMFEGDLNDALQKKIRNFLSTKLDAENYGSVALYSHLQGVVCLKEKEGENLSQELKAEFKEISDKCEFLWHDGILFIVAGIKKGVEPYRWILLIDYCNDKEFPCFSVPIENFRR